MAYKSKGGCTPITAKIQKTTKGGITQPLLNVGAPVKMKVSAPAKQTKGEYTNISFADYRKSGLMKPEEAKFYKGSGSKRVKTADLPTSTSNKSKEKKKSEYTNLTFAQYRKSGLMKPEEAKFYTGGGTKRVKTSDLETKPTQEVKPNNKTKTKPTKRKVSQTKVSTITPKKEVSIETKKPTANAAVTITKTAKPTENQTNKLNRKSKAIDKKLAKADKARAAGNIKKAERKEKRATKKAARVLKRQGSRNSQAANAINPS
jgi:hypothetical protein